MAKYGYKNIEFQNESVKKWWRPNIDRETLKELHKKRDFPAVCKTSFIFHYKGVSTFEVFDNYGKISNDVVEWKKQRDLRGG